MKISLPILIAYACLIFLAMVLLLGGRHYHNQYCKAHIAADRRPTTQPVGTQLVRGVSPEPFYRRAQLTTSGIFVIFVISLVVAVRTRRWMSFVLLGVCFVILVIAALGTGVRL